MSESTATDDAVGECKGRNTGGGARVTSLDFTGLDVAGVIGLAVGGRAGVCGLEEDPREGGLPAVALLRSGVDRGGGRESLPIVDRELREPDTRFEGRDAEETLVAFVLLCNAVGVEEFLAQPAERGKP